MFRHLVAVAAGLLLAAPAVAADNKFAVVTVNNNTKDLTFNFEYRWGDGKWAAVKELKPGKALWFSIELDAKGRAPEFELRLNRAIGNAKPLGKSFFLQGKPAPKQAAELGKQYEIGRDLLERNYVWVFESDRLR